MSAELKHVLVEHVLVRDDRSRDDERSKHEPVGGFCQGLVLAHVLRRARGRPSSAREALRPRARAVPHRVRRGQGARCVLPSHGRAPRAWRQDRRRRDRVPVPCMEVRRRGQVRRDSVRQAHSAEGKRTVLAGGRTQRHDLRLARSREEPARLGDPGARRVE